MAPETPAGVRQKLRGAAERKSEPNGESLQTIIQDAQNLFVVGVPRLGVGQLIQIDQLIEEHEHSIEPSMSREARHQFQVVVDGGIVDDGSHAERVPCLRASAELTSKPSDGVGIELLFSDRKSTPLNSSHLGISYSG